MTGGRARASQVAVTLGLCAAMFGVVAGCNDRKPARDVALSDLEVERAAAHVPREEAVFIEALFPQKHAQIMVAYGIEGAGGMTGSLEVWTAAGALRREVLTANIAGAGADATSKVEGLTIQRPGVLYRRAGADGEESRSAVPFQRLATAWSKLPDERRARALEHVRRWHELRSEAFASKPGDRREVAGQSCTQTRLGGQSICLWEEEGVVLAYESEAFTVMALRVERSSAVDSERFTIPGAGDGAGLEPPSEEALAETSALLAAIEAGDMGTLAPLVHPGFRFAVGAPAP